MNENENKFTSNSNILMYNNNDININNKQEKSEIII